MALRRSTRRAIVTVLLATTLLAGAGSAWALDRFVIDHVEIANVAEYEASQRGEVNDAESASAPEPPTADTAVMSDQTSTSEAIVTDSRYTSDGVSIDISRHTYGEGTDKVTYYVADVVLDDGTDLRSAFANNAFGRNITALVSQTADDVGAVFAINGDYYGFRETGILIRNGVIYRDDGARERLAIYEDGHMELYDETATSAQELLDAGVWNTLSFGPGLVRDGQPMSGINEVEIDTNFGNHSIQGAQPRTGIGAIDDNHFIFVVVDGRSEGYSRGVTMEEFAQIFVDLNAESAYNLDGGGSAEMWFNGVVVNRPSNGGERDTSDIIYIAGES